MNTNRMLLLLLCLSLAAVPAVGQAIQLYDTGTPNLAADPTGTRLDGAPPLDMAAGSFWCLYTDCDIEGFTFWSFNNSGTQSNISSITWQFDPVVFNFKGINTGTNDVLQIGDCSGGPTGTTYCLNSLSLGTSIDVPVGKYYFWLSNAQVAQGQDTTVFWADTKVDGQPSDSFTLENGMITPYPDPKSFAVFGEPTGPPVPEPSSLLLLGSGVLGGLGLLRRRLLP